MLKSEGRSAGEPGSAARGGVLTIMVVLVDRRKYRVRVCRALPTAVTSSGKSKQTSILQRHWLTFHYRNTLSDSEQH